MKITILPKTDVSGSNISGSFTQSGLFNGGRVTVVSLNDTTWTELPAPPLANRNAISIQNTSGGNIKLNYDPLIAGFVGVLVTSGGERMYVITDSIPVYAKCELGTASIVVEELS
jgi:hypothetical protein